MGKEISRQTRLGESSGAPQFSQVKEIPALCKMKLARALALDKTLRGKGNVGEQKGQSSQTTKSCHGAPRTSGVNVGREAGCYKASAVTSRRYVSNRLKLMGAKR